MKNILLPASVIVGIAGGVAVNLLSGTIQPKLETEYGRIAVATISLLIAIIAGVATYFIGNKLQRKASNEKVQNAGISTMANDNSTATSISFNTGTITINRPTSTSNKVANLVFVPIDKQPSN